MSFNCQLRLLFSWFCPSQIWHNILIPLQYLGRELVHPRGDHWAPKSTGRLRLDQKIEAISLIKSGSGKGCNFGTVEPKNLMYGSICRAWHQECCKLSRFWKFWNRCHGDLKTLWFCSESGYQVTICSVWYLGQYLSACKKWAKSTRPFLR